MKQALILHGTDGYPQENWYSWLKEQLEKHSWQVWLPQLPGADKPDIERYNQFIFDNKDWQFNENTVLIGHSSGAVAILGLLMALPGGGKVDRCYLVGAFKNDLGWESLVDLFDKPFDFAKIKSKAKKIVFIHSDNDPYCPVEHAEYLSEKLGGELIIMKNQKHFSVGTMGQKYKEFPVLLQRVVD